MVWRVKVLLDTHILLWWSDDDPKLSSELRALIVDGANDLLVSSITVAEIEIKKALGKLSVPRELLTILQEAGIGVLPLSAEHAQTLRDLPPHHSDPFDRMLIAQAQIENIRLATANAAFDAYDVNLLRN